MNRLQFRVLYREFLFRVVDLESLSPQGDMSKLLGQFGALLVFLSVGFSFGALGFDNRMPREAFLIAAWGAQHSLIATTMVVVGLCTVLAWDNTFPDRRDVLVLAPLPVSPGTLFLAKVAASASALSLAVVALNALSGIAWPLVLAPPSMNLIDLILMPAVYRGFAAYWTTMLAGGAFIFCSVLGLQGAAAQLLPRPQFMRLSAWLQMAAFCLFLSVYFLQPALATPDALAAPENQRLLAWLPSYWFLGLFQQLNGALHPAMAPLAQRAWTGLSIAVLAALAACWLCYDRTLGKIVEEPDIVPRPCGRRWPGRLGNSLETAVLEFAVRALLRSRRHRVMLAFYLGIGLAIVLLLMKSGVGHEQHFADGAETRLMFSSFVIMTVSIVGIRVVFSLPLTLRANWIFRLTQVHQPKEYFAAIRRSIFLLAVLPVWLAAVVFFQLIWPWRPALGHVAVLGLWGILLAYLGLHGFQKIPFTCSYLPGKSCFHMAFLAAVGLILLIGKGVEFEKRALEDPVSYARMVLVLSLAALSARWWMVTSANSEETLVQFEELAPPAVLTLGLRGTTVD
jgi:hypothetical protein